MRQSSYGKPFQEFIKDDSVRSADRVVPIVVSLLRPRSAVDVGCGTGGWLSVFLNAGVEDILGIDGEYVDRQALLISQERFLGRDISRPIQLQRRFDLVISVEVAEHLPADRADDYLDNLTSLGDAIVFSAAIPNQGGIGHVNEQWPEYWKERFEARGYVLVDCLRRRIWNDRQIERWYRQNLLLYVKPSLLEANSELRVQHEQSHGQVLSIVHPETFYPLSFPQLIRSVPGSLERGFKRVLRNRR